MYFVPLNLPGEHIVKLQHRDRISHQVVLPPLLVVHLLRGDRIVRLLPVLSRLVHPDHPLLPLILKHPRWERNTFHYDQATGWQCIFSWPPAAGC